MRCFLLFLLLFVSSCENENGVRLEEDIAQAGRDLINLEDTNFKAISESIEWIVENEYDKIFNELIKDENVWEPLLTGLWGWIKKNFRIIKIGQPNMLEYMEKTRKVSDPDRITYKQYIQAIQDEETRLRIFSFLKQKFRTRLDQLLEFTSDPQQRTELFIGTGYIAVMVFIFVNVARSKVFQQKVTNLDSWYSDSALPLVSITFFLGLMDKFFDKVRDRLEAIGEFQSSKAFVNVIQSIVSVVLSGATIGLTKNLLNEGDPLKHLNDDKGQFKSPLPSWFWKKYIGTKKRAVRSVFFRSQQSYRLINRIISGKILIAYLDNFLNSFKNVIRKAPVLR